MIMKEDFLHYIFKKHLWLDNPVQLTDGRRIEIIDTGQHNHDSGPDFFNAKIKIDNTIWVGNIEIHINSSDWYKHKHDEDPAYSNVILHIVYKHDKPVFTKHRTEIPVWEMTFPQIIFNKFEEFRLSENQIPCTDYRDLIEKEIFNIHIEKMGIERLEYKSEFINELLIKSNNDWEYAFYVNLVRSFGAGVNSDAFEQLAINTPLKILRKYSDNLFKLEAILFGQSGLLEVANLDEYVIKLKTEYNFLRKMHDLSPISATNWKFSKMRPSNLPHIKIAQFASMMTFFHGLFTAVINEPDYTILKKTFKIKVSEYWTKHYSFGKITNKTMSGFGNTAFETILINTVAPFIFVFNKDKISEDSQSKHYMLLNSLKPEDNREVRLWKIFGVRPSNAFETQALLHLKKNYCDKRKCLKCSIGQHIMQQINNL
ncbi:MAG: DUF2851 family protein [Bacteroidales bacterium]|nr:DUF2851 family protein [Bacteroidales bacterium]MDD4215903.1 DUF2851 family protein [Bacteroidales bacterium]MDY0141162.1 DUF2851 family protein [Bacteroidales bacterium]